MSDPQFVHDPTRPESRKTHDLPLSKSSLPNSPEFASVRMIAQFGKNRATISGLVMPAKSLRPLPFNNLALRKIFPVGKRDQSRKASR